MVLHTEAQQVQHHAHGIAANVLCLGLSMLGLLGVLGMLSLCLLLKLLTARPRASSLRTACCLTSQTDPLKLARRALSQNSGSNVSQTVVKLVPNGVRMPACANRNSSIEPVRANSLESSPYKNVLIHDLVRRQYLN